MTKNNNEIKNIEEKSQKKSVIESMAERYGMERQAFEQVITKTIMPTNHKKEELVAFLSVAKEYSLNPLTKEIYAFPSRGGGITPIVSIDGWCRIINDHPQFNGVEFEDIIENGKVSAIKCIISRKDRENPITTTEYLDECQGMTQPWKQWPRRMLRHKALIQCARYAFGFSGIYDKDEAERIDSVIDVTRKSNTSPTLSKLPDVKPEFEEKEQEEVQGEIFENNK